MSSGPVARIYLAAYPQWRSCYKIAEVIFPGVKTRNVAGRVSKIVSHNLALFDTRLEKAGDLKMVTLVRSKSKPFLDAIVKKCNLTPEEEKEALGKYLDSEFRNALNVYMETTLKTTPDYLRRDLNAVEELLTVLAILFCIGRLYNKYGADAKNLVSRLAQLAAPKLFGKPDLIRGHELKPLEDVAHVIPAEMLNRIYEKLVPAVPDEYQPLLYLLDGFAVYLEEIQHNPQAAESLLKLFLKSWSAFGK